jgi:hypothetical protein
MFFCQGVETFQNEYLGPTRPLPTEGFFFGARNFLSRTLQFFLPLFCGVSQLSVSPNDFRPRSRRTAFPGRDRSRRHRPVITRSQSAEANHPGRPPLHPTSWEGHKYIVRLLFNYGAEANPTDDDDLTSLHVALPEGYDEIVELLLDHGAYANPVDCEGLNSIASYITEGA